MSMKSLAYGFKRAVCCIPSRSSKESVSSSVELATLQAPIPQLETKSSPEEVRALYATIPLHRPKRDIRILEIIETLPQIRCRLEPVSLDDCPEFCALSYVWGDPRAREDILVNNVCVSVTKSLADALSYVGFHYCQALQVPEGTKFCIWADAICINQEDNTEKGHQVPLMKEIYSSSKLTFCSLEPISPTSRVPEACDIIMELATRLDQRGDDVDLVNYSVATELFEKLEAPTDPNHVFGAIDYLATLPYWKRAWIFQELVLSAEGAVFFYADNVLRMGAYERVKEWAQAIRQLFKTQPPPDNVGFDIRKWTNLGMMRYVMDAQEEIMLAEASQEDRHGPDKIHPSKSLWQMGIFTGTLLKASNPKDYVYATLGITGLDIMPRYGDDTSVAAVYAEFCEKLISIIPRMGEGIPPLGFLYLAGLANGSPGQFDLPTWAPNFPACSERIRYHNPSLAADETNPPLYRGHKDREGGLYIQDKSLLTSCLAIETLEELSNVYVDLVNTATSLRPVFKMMKQVFESSNRSFIAEDHPLGKIAAAFCDRRVTWQSPEMLQVTRMLSLIHYNATGSGRKAFGMKFLIELCCSLRDFRKSIPLSDQSFERMQESIEEYARFLAYWGTQHGFKDWVQEMLLSLQFLPERGIRIARTTESNFAVVPPEASKGDQIAILDGFDSLCLIRKVRDHYIYVGPVGYPREIVDARIEQAMADGDKFKRIEMR